MPGSDPLPFDRMDLQATAIRDDFIAITQDYFDWMNGEIVRFCNLSIPDMVGMGVADYVRHTAEIAGRIGPEDGGIYARRNAAGQIMAMGGLRRLPDGTAEIVRIFTRPAFRGQGLGFQTVSHLVDEAGQLGYGILRLDTAVFMKSAQKIYRAAGFSLREPYEGAEPPPQLLPFWLFMERAL
ncbi:GNAT family N-acetyltransferase [Kaistia dalseonensis]|uniref:GNAT superfamily N-acetyltransferase n=1 Tax=Kaistia dalseonensis TaxID=410840 RepID=A0ABU0H3U9_9HYPH|nr:GNAT family N-acetyltransferase [Kaistia dalseonensis]MCX5494408.1 GNAT family N-acetyltransferase [Kaistia dalseonensis]MDQ0436987.1 GNAT superfamily N-acetyltransferase [Kaistia dalseonensis]